MMNQTAQQLGMTQTSYVNPNGLPADGQITSARDLAILARAIIHDLPEYEYFVHIPSIRFGRRVTQNFNKLIGRYPGADGFKTGFICASGYNLVASATRNGKRLIAVVLGASSGTMRAVRAAQLLDRGFASNTLSWLRPSLGTVDNLAPIDASPPNLRDEMCGGKHKRPASDEDEDTVASTSAARQQRRKPALTFFAAGLQPPMVKPSELLAAAAAPSEPIVVYTGPTRTGAALIAAVAADTEKQTPRQRGKKIAGRSEEARRRGSKPKPDAKAEPSLHAKQRSQTDAKPVRHAECQAGRQPPQPPTSPLPSRRPSPRPPQSRRQSRRPSLPPKNTSRQRPSQDRAG